MRTNVKEDQWETKKIYKKNAQRRPKRQRRRMSEDEDINLDASASSLTNVLAELEEIKVEFWLYKYKRYDSKMNETPCIPRRLKSLKTLR